MIIDSITLAGIAAGVGVMLLCVGLAVHLRSRRWQARLNTTITQYVQPADVNIIDSPVQANSEPWVNRLNRFVRGLNAIPALRVRLQRAGVEMQPARFLVLQVILGLVGMLVALVAFSDVQPLVHLLAAIAGLLLGYQLPRPILRVKASRRAKRFDDQLPDAIDILAGALEAGSSLAQAMVLVSEEMKGAVADELSRVVLDQELGVSQQDALERLLDRMPSEDLDMLITAIDIQYRVGGNLANILRNISLTIRERQRIKREVRTLTSQGRTSAKLVTVVPFALSGVLYLLNRPYISTLFTTTPGRIMSVAAVVMICLGYFFMNKIVSIKV